jgi:hypothetical protein
MGVHDLLAGPSHRACFPRRDLAVERAREVGLLDPQAAYSAGNYRRDHVVGLDGKVFSSPLRNLETERVDKATGELRPVRQDTARQRYGEGGVDGIVRGTKFAIASVRSPLANHRVILGIAHFDSKAPGGEGRVLTDLAADLANRTHGIQAFTADGAWRGTHLSQIQTTTGRGVIAPARRRTGRNGGIVINGHGHATALGRVCERRVEIGGSLDRAACTRCPCTNSARSAATRTGCAR